MPHFTREEMIWAGLFLVSVLLVGLAHHLPVLRGFPAGLTLPLSEALNTVISPVFETLRPLGRVLSFMIETPLSAIRAGLAWAPWPATVLALVALALYAGGRGLAVFAALALGLVVLMGYWPRAMNTLALVLISVPLAVGIGFALGTLGHLVPRVRPGLTFLLDVMQTWPAFGYLIPLLLMFGFGPAAGLAASVIFSIPPMVRNTMLGLDEVPPAIVESALMAGARPGQLFWQARVPVALPQLMVGVNQTTMASLSMVIIIAIIGGFNDIGWEVLSAMRAAELGRSLGAGLVIVLIAVLLDRITRGLAGRRRRSGGWFMAGLIVALVLVVVLPGEALLPGEEAQRWLRRLDAWLLDFVAWSAPFFALLRDAITYGLMLPMRLGFSGSASPMVWGFVLSPPVIFAYVLVATGIALGLGWRRPGRGIAFAFAALIFWTGLPGFPWPGVFLLTACATFRAGGAGLTALATGALLLAGVSGLWQPMMQSIYLCAVAVLISFAIGATLGVIAAESDRVSALMRPVCDTLQTMPQFVFLIPALMLFRVGEFTALIAIVLYAVVPPIRYVEHGLRNARADLTEAGLQMGATRWQLLWQVKLPLARGSVRLGLNQTIMAALSMLVIAALVGTRELGQQVYVALSKADAGAGLIAGGIIAAIALVADRLLRAPEGKSGDKT
ncbi:proline/glycine betaine ABC transporter permease [Rhodobacter sp. 24-YEA-8]|uniref:ABC transporter permease n=1 Tax=Rhodobacter sp. 24-YEA-8 TaxID=1884310 RepID=UPI00089CDE69|nr:ABC transporter permease subunit [Rhodobacter sp. 24-YEA-8]SEC72357.1 glycine betaine/proline transport system permease protein [Rhodobacter sp. 24-YEA-8]